MNPAPALTVSQEINRLHEQAKAQSVQSRQALNGALAAAWQAGHLLRSEKQRVRHGMGRGAWLFWLEANFSGTPRTAQRYMRLAQSVTDVTFMQGMSLRLAYARLGIATESKTPAKCPLAHKLPRHVVLANKLDRVLEYRTDKSGPEQGEAYRRDMRVLYAKLRSWFEAVGSHAPALAKFRAPVCAHRP